MRKRIIIALALLALAIPFILYGTQSEFSGNRVKSREQYILEFERMNQEDSHALALHEGDTLSVEFAIDRGRVDLFIGMAGAEALYRGNDIDSGSFVLTAPKDGDYQITIQAKHAAGYIRINAPGSA